jgi:hypothetical protein
MIELERLYLASSLPADINHHQVEEIHDIYLPADVEHAHLQLRKHVKKISLTMHSPKKKC